MDFPAMCASLAAKYDGLSDGAGTTLRASYAQTPDGIAPPCAVTILAGLENVQPQGAGYLTGTASVDVLVLLDASSTVDRRYAAMLRFVGPALLASMSGNQLGQYGSLAGAIPSAVEVSLAGDSEVYAGLPYDLVRVRYAVPFKVAAGMTP